MDDSFVVRRGEGLRNLGRDVDRLSRRQRSGPQPLAQRLALEQLHDENVARRGTGRGGDRGFLRMNRGWRSLDDSGREQLRLALEARSRLFTFEELFRKDLQRDHPVEPRVPGPVDLSHPARAEQREDFVGAELRAGLERQLTKESSPVSAPAASRHLTGDLLGRINEGLLLDFRGPVHDDAQRTLVGQHFRDNREEAHSVRRDVESRPARATLELRRATSERRAEATATSATGTDMRRRSPGQEEQLPPVAAPAHDACALRRYAHFSRPARGTASRRPRAVRTRWR